MLNCFFSDISTQEVHDIIQAIPTSKATGTDGLSIKLLKIAAPAIIESLTKLINICIARGVFPTVWKEAKVTPLHNNGVKSDKNNYRPIPVLPVISKVLERHLHNAIHTFLKNNNLLYRFQSGFRGQHSTETALINIYDRLVNNLDKNFTNGMVFADFKKLMLVTGKRLKSKLSPDEQVLNITTSKGVLLEQVPCYKALGVIFDQNLSFNDHTDALCKKLIMRISLLNSIRHNLPNRERIQFYNAIIKPLFMYGGLVWSMTSQENLDRLFKLQKRAARVILNTKLREERTMTLFKKLKWIPFTDELKINKCCMVFKSLNELAPSYVAEKFVTVSQISS